jgi:hypothetical protein
METPKVYQPGEGGDPEVPTDFIEDVPPAEEIVVEEGFKEDDAADAEADDSYAKHRSENR